MGVSSLIYAFRGDLDIQYRAWTKRGVYRRAASLGALRTEVRCPVPWAYPAGPLQVK